MSKQLRVEVAKVPYRRLMPFNRYYIEKFDGLVLLHFGLLTPAGQLMDHYSCGCTQVELDNLKKSLMDYLGRTGSLGDAPPEWRPPIGMKPVDLCNYIGVCGNQYIAETTLNNMVAKELADLKPSQNTAIADTIVLLRSTLELQKHWIKDLYK